MPVAGYTQHTHFFAPVGKDTTFEFIRDVYPSTSLHPAQMNMIVDRYFPITTPYVS